MESLRCVRGVTKSWGVCPPCTVTTACESVQSCETSGDAPVCSSILCISWLLFTQRCLCVLMQWLRASGVGWQRQRAFRHKSTTHACHTVLAYPHMGAYACMHRGRRNAVMRSHYPVKHPSNARMRDVAVLCGNKPSGLLLPPHARIADTCRPAQAQQRQLAQPCGLAS